jgi:hypothetical protein
MSEKAKPAAKSLESMSTSELICLRSQIKGKRENLLLVLESRLISTAQRTEIEGALSESTKALKEIEKQIGKKSVKALHDILNGLELPKE